MTELVFATGNSHKLGEARKILSGAIEVIGYDGPEPVESGLSFLENAMIKARAAFEHTGLPSVADDSGLAVEVLGGSPGIFSARWAGGRDNVTCLLATVIDGAPVSTDGALLGAVRDPWNIVDAAAVRMPHSA